MEIISPAQFHQNLQNLSPNLANKSFLLAVSGGADSMVMLHLFRTYGISFEVAHVNYHLRGEDSNLDQQLVENYCQNHQIVFHLFDVAEEKPETGIELWARELRYHFFEETRQKFHFDFICTAHHLGDQLETFLINLSKASGLKGLHGIPAQRDRILRPMLSYTKAAIYRFAQENQISFREDHTNHESEFTRNRIRNLITPQLEALHPQFWDNFEKSLTYLKEAHDFIEKQLEEILSDLILERSEGALVLDKNKLAAQDNLVRYEILKRLGFPSEKEQEKFFQAEKGARFLGENKFLLVDRDQFLILDSLPEENSQEILINFNTKTENPVFIQISDQKIKDLTDFWEVDATKLRLPLKLRKPRKGDVFYPTGMLGKKAVSKFFRDAKIPIIAKMSAWLLTDADDRIIGILKYRQDRRFLPEKNCEKIYIYQ